MGNQTEMDMLCRDKIIVIVWISLFLFSCKGRNDGKDVLYKNIAINAIGNIDMYKQILAGINDSLSNWEINNIAGYRSGNCDYSKYKVDSLLCFNKSKNRLVTCLLESGCDGDYGDGIHLFYGAKIKGQWYYFNGAYIYLPRKSYQKDASKPLSFSKLHEIAMQEVFSGYLVRKKKDAGVWKNLFAPEYEYEVNESWFDAHFKNKGICSDCKTEEDFEKVWLYNSQSQWKNK